MFAKGKEKKPQETVQNIKRILEKLDIELNEIGYECMNGLSSVQLYDPMCNWRVWGKGTNPEWALASAYGEAVERLSNFPMVTNHNLFSTGGIPLPVFSWIVTVYSGFLTTRTVVCV